MIKNILRLEGLVFFLAALYFYNQIQGNWIVFILLLLVPDISMIGYVKDKKIGAQIYNLVHNYILGIVIVALGILFNNNLVVFLGIILFAHVSIDRFFGFGLKYPTDFKDTHLQKV